MSGWRIALWVALLVIFFWFVYSVRSVLFPFVLSFLLAALLEPSVRKLRLRGLSRGISVLFVLVVFFGFIGGVFAMITPHAVNQVKKMSESVRSLTDTLQKENEKANFFIRWNPAQLAAATAQPSALDSVLKNNAGTLKSLGLPATKEELIRDYIEPRRPQINNFVKNAIGGLIGVAGSIASQVLTLLFVPLITFLILLDLENLKRRAPKWIPPQFRESVVRITGDIWGVFLKYLRGISLVCALYIGLCMIVLSLLQVPYALIVSVVFGVLYLIPYLGGVLVYISIFCLVGLNGVTGTFGLHMAPWTYAALATGVWFVVGLAFDQVVYPQVVGNAVGLNPVTSMFALFCGASLFGLVGMLLAFPVGGSLKIIIERLMKITSEQQEELNLPMVPMRHRVDT